MVSKTARQRIVRNYYRHQKSIFDPIPTSNPITEHVETRTEPIEAPIRMPPSVDVFMPYVSQNGNGNHRNGTGNYQHGFTDLRNKQRMIDEVFSMWPNLDVKRDWEGIIDYKRQKPKKHKESIRTFFAEMQYNLKVNKKK